MENSDASYQFLWYSSGTYAPNPSVIHIPFFLKTITTTYFQAHFPHSCLNDYEGAVSGSDSPLKITMGRSRGNSARAFRTFMQICCHKHLLI